MDSWSVHNFYNLRFHFFMDSWDVSFDCFSFLLQEQFSQLDQLK